MYRENIQLYYLRVKNTTILEVGTITILCGAAATWVTEHVESLVGKTNALLRKEFQLFPINKDTTSICTPFHFHRYA